MKHLLSIGKFAALCNTTTDTLIHYDHLGLLKPTHTTDGHRRLYDVGQYHNFCLIHTLAEVGTPLQEIKIFMEAETFPEQIKILQNKELLLKQKLQSLQETISYFQSLCAFPDKNMRVTTNQPFIQNHTTMRPLFCTSFPCPTGTVSDLVQALQTHVSQCATKQLYPFPLGILTQRRDRGLPNKKHYFITSPWNHSVLDNRCFIKQPGDYATLYHSGSLLTVKQSVDQLYDYIHENHYTIAGDTFITLYDNGSLQKQEPIYQIEILICKN